MKPTKDTPFVQALGRVASGLFIVTAADAHERTGFLGSFVQQASFEPLIFSIACRADRHACHMIHKTKKFGLNIISETDKVLMKTFAKGVGPGEDPLAHLHVHESHHVPLLKEAVGAAVFEVVSETQPGDHVIFFGRAIDGCLFHNTLKPWVHVRNSALTY